MRRLLERIFSVVLGLGLVSLVPSLAFAQEAEKSGGSIVGLGAAITMGLAAIGGTVAQGMAVSSGLEAIGRNPGASGKLFTPMLIGLAFVESLVILAFVIAIQLT